MNAPVEPQPHAEASEDQPRAGEADLQDPTVNDVPQRPHPGEADLAPAIEILTHRGDEFIEHIFAYLFAHNPAFYNRFPADRTHLSQQLRRALLHVYSKQASANGLDRRTRRFLRHLAEDHRSFGVEAHDYEAMGAAIINAASVVIAPRVSSEVMDLFAMATSQIVGIMAEAAEDFSEVPVRWGATVTDVDRRSDAITVVRLHVDEAIPYEAGQYVPVLAPQSLGQRLNLSPAIPSDDDGLMEFHVEAPRNVGVASGSGLGSGAVEKSERLGSSSAHAGQFSESAADNGSESAADGAEGRNSDGAADSGEGRNNERAADNAEGRNSERAAEGAEGRNSDGAATVSQQEHRATDKIAFNLARMTRPGDSWDLGAPRGPISAQKLRESKEPIVMVAYGAGLAAVRAVLLELSAVENPPEVTVIFGAEYPADLYELRTLWSFGQAMPWLTVKACTEKAEDEPFARKSPSAIAPASFHIEKGTTLHEFLDKQGPWSDELFVLSGNSEVVAELKKNLVQQGISSIVHNPLGR